jgi:hypothetical protein
VKPQPKRGSQEPTHAYGEFIKFNRKGYPPNRQGAILSAGLEDFGVVVGRDYLSQTPPTGIFVNVAA